MTKKPTREKNTLTAAQKAEKAKEHIEITKQIRGDENDVVRYTALAEDRRVLARKLLIEARELVEKANFYRGEVRQFRKYLKCIKRKR